MTPFIHIACFVVVYCTVCELRSNIQFTGYNILPTISLCLKVSALYVSSNS